MTISLDPKLRLPVNRNQLNEPIKPFNLSVPWLSYLEMRVSSWALSTGSLLTFCSMSESILSAPQEGTQALGSGRTESSQVHSAWLEFAPQDSSCVRYGGGPRHIFESCIPSWLCYILSILTWEACQVIVWIVCSNCMNKEKDQPQAMAEKRGTLGAVAIK